MKEIAWFDYYFSYTVRTTAIIDLYRSHFDCWTCSLLPKIATGHTMSSIMKIRYEELRDTLFQAFLWENNFIILLDEIDVERQKRSWIWPNFHLNHICFSSRKHSLKNMAGNGKVKNFEQKNVPFFTINIYFQCKVNSQTIDNNIKSHSSQFKTFDKLIVSTRNLDEKWCYYW